MPFRTQFLFPFYMGLDHLTFCRYSIVSFNARLKECLLFYQFEEEHNDWLVTLCSRFSKVKLGCLLGNSGWVGTGGVIRDHFGTVLRAFSKHAEMGLAIKAEILTLLEGLM